nr:DUF6879 family protein [Streptomyces sp. H27-S2]
MFRTFAHTAWRLETRRRYQSDEETETYQRFIRGEDAGWDLDDPWCVSRREQSALGERFERVRIADNLPTPGQRYLLDNARRNGAVGEDIRNLWRSEAERLQLPDEDFWLFDVWQGPPSWACSRPPSTPATSSPATPTSTSPSGTRRRPYRPA